MKIRNPQVSVRMWRLRPLIFLPASPGSGFASPRTGVAPNPTTLGGFDALPVDHSGRWRGLASLDFAQVHHQNGVDRLEQSGVAPSVEIPPHRRNRREAVGQHPPRAAARCNLEQRIQHLAHVRRASPPARLRRPPDFAGGTNGAVTDHSRSVKSLGYRNPSRLCSRRAIPVHPIASSIFSTKTAESQDAGIAQHLSDRALRLTRSAVCKNRSRLAEKREGERER